MLNPQSRTPKIAVLVVGLLLVQGLVSQVGADVLLIETIEQAPSNSAKGLPRPVRGMLMSDVEHIHGQALEKTPAVGEPPVSRWKYAGFTVFFEHQHVVHSVVHRASSP